MKKGKITGLVMSAAFAAACLAGLASCSSLSTLNTVGGTAATVNGTEIKELKVTNYIEDFRSTQGLDDDDSWAAWMSSYGVTPETTREQVINYYVDEEVIKQAAAEKGVSVSSEDVDAEVESMKANYGTDEEWQSALEQNGTTEEQYRESLESSMLSEALENKLAEDGELDDLESESSDEEVLEYVAMYAPSFDGAKRSSHILFAADDEATAQEVLDKINSGELDFAEAAKQYSIDETSAEDGGDVGWDMLNSFVTEYGDALADLDKDQVSALVTSEYGIHIIKCTDVYAAPDEITSLDDAPDALVDYIRQMLSSNSESSAYSTWLSNYKEGLDIQINDMPDGLPYDVDMSAYESTSDDGESTDATESADGESETSQSSDGESAESADGQAAKSADGQ